MLVFITPPVFIYCPGNIFSHFSSDIKFNSWHVNSCTLCFIYVAYNFHVSVLLQFLWPSYVASFCHDSVKLLTVFMSQLHCLQFPLLSYVAYSFHCSFMLLTFFMTQLCCLQFSCLSYVAYSFHVSVTLLTVFITQLCCLQFSWLIYVAYSFHVAVILLTVFIAQLCLLTIFIAQLCCLQFSLLCCVADSFHGSVMLLTVYSIQITLTVSSRLLILQLLLPIFFISFYQIFGLWEIVKFKKSRNFPHIVTELSCLNCCYSYVNLCI